MRSICCLVLALPMLAWRPPAQTPTCVRYFSLSGKVDVEALRGALADAKGGAHRIVAGPSSCKARPKQSFVAVEVPFDANLRELTHRLKRGSEGVEELAWTCFRGVDKQLPDVLSQSPRDCVIGMASEMRWFEVEGDAKYFFHLPGKLAPKDIASRFRRLYEPFEAGDVGTLGRETATVALRDAPDAKALERALKAIQKLAGVKKAAAEGTTITIEVELAGLASGAPPPAVPDGASIATSPRFDASPALAIVAKEGLAPEKK